MPSHLKIELAQVNSVADPLGLGRVKVAYADGLISDWLQVASPFAGPEFGLFALPQEDTPALVAFATNERTTGYVIGFLWSGKSRPPVADNEQQQRVWILKTKSGKKITLDDSEQPSIEIADEKGNYVKLDTRADKISLFSNGDVSISALKRVTISGSEINLNEG